VRRREAVQLFREICECSPGLFVNSVSLLTSNSSKEVILRINVFLDGVNLKGVQSIVEAHKLILEEDEGGFLIHDSKTKINEKKILAQGFRLKAST
jgi:hypothetical protein